MYRMYYRLCCLRVDEQLGHCHSEAVRDTTDTPRVYVVVVRLRIDAAVPGSHDVSQVYPRAGTLTSRRPIKTPAT